MATTYPQCDAQQARPTILSEPAPKEVKRSALERAAERWFGPNRKASPIALGILWLTNI